MGKTKFKPFNMIRLTHRLSGWFMFECACGYRRTMPRISETLADIDRHRSMHLSR